MHGFLKFIKTTLIGGALVVLPAWIAILLFLQLLVKMEVIVKPVSSHLPKSVAHPQIISIALMILACFLVGMIVRTAFGSGIKTAVEKSLLEKLPGYTTLQNVATQIADLKENHGFQPALVEIEEALAPCFIVEVIDSGQWTVFIPSAPTPAAGSILIVSSDRVHPVDVPVTKLFKIVTKWGTGCRELLAALPKDSPHLK